MRTLVIGFSTGHSWLSKAIKFFDQSPFSHVYVMWQSESIGRDIIYQASGTAVNFMNRERFDSTSTTLQKIEIQVSDEQFKKCMQFCVDNSNMPYGIKQILGMAYVRALKVFGRNVKNPYRDGKATYVCSELVGHLLSNATDVKVSLDLEIAGPRELYEYLKKLGY